MIDNISQKRILSGEHNVLGFKYVQIFKSYTLDCLPGNIQHFDTLL